LSGKQFGRLTVIKYSGRAKNNGSTWLCQCNCGKTKIIQAINLKSGNSQSCGCIKIEQSKARAKPHGLVRSPTYSSWANMLSRCFNPQKSDAPLYKDRGITVCPQWKSFDNFLADMGKKPKGCVIDRIDTNGNYEPSNCKWVSAQDSARNKRTSKIWIVHDKKFKTMDEAAQYLNVTTAVVHRRCCGKTIRGKFLPKYEGYGFEYKYPKEQHAIYK
jgi:hypothetical protein